MIIQVKVKPNSARQEVEKISDEEYKVYLKKPAENNKANLELLRLLHKYFNKEVRFVKGLKNKNKVIEVINGYKI
tara:strand:- start:74 stop:298 length:225 start_codon:yes stop_codon:yes gene_type:complete